VRRNEAGDPVAPFVLVVQPADGDAVVARHLLRANPAWN
jgi:hypothetical protein